MKRKDGLSAVTGSLAVATWTGSFVCLVIGTGGFALGLGVWLGFASVSLLVLWVGDQIVSELKTEHKKGDDSRNE